MLPTSTASAAAPVSAKDARHGPKKSLPAGFAQSVKNANAAATARTTKPEATNRCANHDGSKALSAIQAAHSMTK
jgi:hypothetical protein